MHPKLKFSSFFFILLSVTAHAQVIIKEKVEITPQVILSNNPAANHSVRVDMTWAPTYIPGSINFYGIPCRDGEFIGYTTGGNLSYQVDNAREGQYAINFGFNIPCAYPRDTVSGHYILSFDNSPVQEHDFIVGGCNDGTSIPFYGVFYTPPLISGYVLSLSNNTSCILTSTTVRLFNANDCNSSTIWNKATETNIGEYFFW